MRTRNRSHLIRLALATAMAAALLGGTACTKVVTAPQGVPTNAVTATGQGKASATPDVAVMTFGVTTRSANPKTALDQASTAAEKITSAIKDLGVGSKDIQTSGISLYPQQDQKGAVNRYEASIAVTVKIKDIEKTGDVIAAANRAGANTISGPNFTVSEESTYRAKAIDEAVKEARVSAQAMAKAAGKTVGNVLSISTTNVNVPITAFEAYAGRAAGAGVPVEPGQVEISADVTVIFELK